MTSSSAIESAMAEKATTGTPAGETVAESPPESTNSPLTVEQEAEVPAKAEATEKPSAKTVPYERFQEVNSAKNEAVTEKNEAISAMEQAVANLEQYQTDAEADKNLHEFNSDLLDRIRDLENDEEMKPYVMAIDRKLKGESPTDEGELEVETEETVEESSELSAEIKQTQETLAELQQEITDQKVDQRNNIILDEARDTLQMYLDDLPEEYTADDKNIIVKATSQNVDWDGIEEDPSTLMKAVSEGLTLTLKEYGTPRGEVAAKAATEAIENHTVESPKTQAQEALDRIEAMDLTELSDEDFTKQLTISMRANKAAQGIF